MSVDLLNFFQLNENFTDSELSSSYNNKIVGIDSLNISPVDKAFYKKNINAMYYEGKRHLELKNSLDNRLSNVDFAMNNAFSHINSFLSNINSFKNNWLSPNITNNVYSQSKESSYKEILNSDNSITVYEETITNSNGIINKTIKSYKKYQDGSIV